MTARRARINRHFRIDADLTPEQLEAYLDYLREPSTTVDSAHAKLREMGHATISRSAVARHLRQYLTGLEKQRRVERQAQAYAHFARSGTFDDRDMIKGALLKVEQRMLEAVFELRRHEVLTPAQLTEFADLILHVINVSRRLRKLDDRSRAAPEAPTVNGEEIAREVRKLLGFPAAPGEN